MECTTISPLMLERMPMKKIDFRQDLLPLKDKIFRLAFRVTLNTQEAEDLTQDTLVRVWSRRDELTEVKSLEAFCIAVCRNMALDRVKRAEQRGIMTCLIRPRESFLRIL